MFRLYVFITETVTSVRITFFIYIGENIYIYMSACDCCRTKGAVIADVSPVCHWHQRHLQPVWEQKNQMWPQETGVGVSGVCPCDELGYVLVMNWGELWYVLVMNWGMSLWWTGHHSQLGSQLQSQNRMSRNPGGFVLLTCIRHWKCCSCYTLVSFQLNCCLFLHTESVCSSAQPQSQRLRVKCH